MHIVELPGAVDGWLIDRIAQPALNELGRRFGVDRVWVMRFFAAAFFIAAAAEVLAFPDPSHPTDGFDLGAITLLGVMTSWVLVSSPTSGRSQRLSPTMFGLRLVWLVLIAFDMASAALQAGFGAHQTIHIIGDIFGALWSYFGACENPPKKQVRRKSAFASVS